MQDIEVSIVIPTYNRSSSLKETLESIFAQTYPVNKYEILVCDDNSSDNTEEVVKSLMEKTQHNLKYIKIKSKIKGPAKVRNAGINQSLGEIIGFTDDDCIVSGNWIETAVENFKKHKNACGVYGTVVTVGDCKNKPFTISRRVDVLSDNGSYVTPNVFYKKQVLLDVGLFDTDMRYMQDIELGWRIRKKGPIIFEPSLYVNHKIFCASIKAYLKRIKKTEYWVLMYSKHPDRMEEDNLILGHFYNRSPIYVLSIFLSFSFLLLGSELFIFLFMITIITYLWTHVFVDDNYKKYPIRLLMFPRYSFADIIRFMYSLKASIKYKCLVLF
ncbi:Glycosyltransferase [Methanosarcina mazei C16]|uniref:Glycosyltransferase n=1 Tax=Methanosarcina mazei C16 TaxID=1434113 RepID=A0A0E3WQR6_METMZ|nr:glycosyltransferase [Methanosarcina mazei]AKB71755.1 Glycosyltransferase [Methanosarcina mazei C16]